MAKRITRSEHEKSKRPLPRTEDPDAPLRKRKRRSDALRPTYRDLVTVEKLTAVGMPLDVVAAECGCSVDTMRRWCKQYEDLAAALRKGRKRRRMRVFSCFFAQAFPMKRTEDGQYVPAGTGNPQLMQFWARTQEGFSERATDEKAIRKLDRKGGSSGSEAPKIIYALKEPLWEEGEGPDLGEGGTDGDG